MLNILPTTTFDSARGYDSVFAQLAAEMQTIPGTSNHDLRISYVEDEHRTRFRVNARIEELFELVMRGRTIPCAEWQELSLKSPLGLPYVASFSDADAIERVAVGVCDVTAPGEKQLMILVHVFRNTGANMVYAVTHTLK